MSYVSKNLGKVTETHDVMATLVTALICYNFRELTSCLQKTTTIAHSVVCSFSSTPLPYLAQVSV